LLRWILLFLVLSVVFAVLGFGGLAASFSAVAQILAVAFAILLVGSMIAQFVSPPRTI
jgi:uncharacterized membrane protein YtjA (UPF0391 family)